MQMESIESEITAFVGDGMIGQNIHEINECNSTNTVNVIKTNCTNIFPPKRRGRRSKRGFENEVPNSVQRSFRLKWLCYPELQGWVTPVPNKLNYVSCKWCKALLRAHLSDLKKHATCKKHRKQSLLHGNPCSGSFSTNVQSRPSQPSSNLSMEENTMLDLGLPVAKHEEINVKHEPKKMGRDCNYTQDSAALPRANSKVLNPANVGFIGAGSMAQALISGFISNGLVEANNLIISAPSNQNLSKLKPLGIRTTHDNKLVIEESDIVFLAVKPHIIPEVLAQFDPLEGDHNPLFVSVATGLSITRLEAMLSHVVSTPRIIRIMPNTPCMVLQGCCVYSLGSNVQADAGKMIKCLLGSVGLCEEVPEYQIDGVCGLAGSGPAYIYAAIEAMADGGVKMGLPRQLAMALAAQTVKGAATMVLETGKHPGELKDNVCSPAGTTIAAMHVLEKNSFRSALISAVEASANRSKELG